MDYEFEVMVEEPIIIDGETVIQIKKIQSNGVVKIGIVGQLEVWREEVPDNQESTLF